MSALTDAIRGSRPVVVDFFATWCGPCKQIAPEFEKLSAQFPSFFFCKVDVDESADIAQNYGISAMPTFMLFNRGTKVGTFEGDFGGLVRAIQQLAQQGVGEGHTLGGAGGGRGTEEEERAKRAAALEARMKAAKQQQQS